ncbi:hypothetical protein [Furfurilactobacillus entadae]|uniref:hypothetical protein n=1 Tax=Furfurilactobacillus entadae TaxID=2922307 RepID=UPI0035E7BAC5
MFNKINQNGDHNHASITNNNMNVSYLIKNTSYTGSNGQGDKWWNFLAWAFFSIFTTLIRSYGLILNELQSHITEIRLTLVTVVITILLYTIVKHKTSSWIKPLGIIPVNALFGILLYQLIHVQPDPAQMNIYANVTFQNLFELGKTNGFSLPVMFPILHITMIMLLVLSAISYVYTILRYQRVGTWSNLVVLMLALVFILNYQQILNFNPTTIQLPSGWPTFNDVLQKSFGLQP